MLIASHNRQKYLMRSVIRFNPSIRSNEVEIRNKTKYLGVLIDEKLNGKEHINETSAKISRAVGLLKYSEQDLRLAC